MSNPDNKSASPTVGCIVHYTLKSGHVRPAIVVHCWDGNPNVSYPPGVVQLQVFVDGSNDGESRYGDDSGIFPEEGRAGLAWRTSVHPSESGNPEPGRWHWPPRA